MIEDVKEMEIRNAQMPERSKMNNDTGYYRSHIIGRLPGSRCFKHKVHKYLTGRAVARNAT